MLPKLKADPKSIVTTAQHIFNFFPRPNPLNCGPSQAWALMNMVRSRNVWNIIIYCSRNNYSTTRQHAVANVSKRGADALEKEAPVKIGMY